MNPTSPCINLLLHDVTLFEAVTALAQQMGMSVSASSNGLMIEPKPDAVFVNQRGEIVREILKKSGDHPESQ